MYIDKSAVKGSTEIRKQAVNLLIDKLIQQYPEAAEDVDTLFHELQTRQIELEIQNEELRESEEKYRDLVESTSDWVWEIDSEGRFIYSNKNIFDLLGYQPEEIMGRTAFEFAIPEHTQQPWKVFHEKKPFKHLQDTRRHRNGTLVTLDTNGIPILDDHGTLLKYRGVTRDITKIKRAEEALQESEKRYRTVFANTGAATVIIDKDTIISLSNTEFERLSGYTSNEVNGRKSWTEFVVKEDFEQMLTQHSLRRQNHDQAKKNYEFRFVTRSGEIRHIYLVIDLIPGTDKSVASLIDITDRKTTEEALQESEEYTKVLFTSSQVPMIVMDAVTGCYIDCNEAAVNIYGYGSREEVLGKTPLDVSAPIQHDGSDSVIEAGKHIQACREHGSHIFEWRHQRPNGQIWDAHVHLMSFTHRGKPLIQFKLQDITEQKRIEEALRESEETLRSLINATNESLLLTDREGKILIANEIVAQRLGKSVQELIGTSQYDYMPPDVAEHRIKQYDKVLLTGKSVHFEDKRRERFYEIFSYPVIDEEGNVSKIAIFAKDITERKRAEAEREQLILELRDALSQIKVLSGLLPICASCKKIRNDNGYWEQIEVYIRDHSEAEFSHGICPECAKKLYPEYM